MTRKEILEKTIDFDDAIHRIVCLEKENANLKKSCDETQELLDKQIEATYKLDKENAELKADNDARKFAMVMREKVEKRLRNERNTFLAQNEQYEKDLIDFNENLTKAKEIMKIAIEGIKYWGFVGGTERPFVKQAEMLFNLFLDKAEQFLNKEVEK